MKNLIYSSNKVDFEAVKAIETPAPNWMRKEDTEGKGNHFPIPHDRLINEARQSLKENGFTIEQEEHGLSEGNMNCFSASPALIVRNVSSSWGFATPTTKNLLVVSRLATL